MESIWRDLRYGARALRKNPGLTAIAVVAFTLGIGLTTTMFSIVYGALFRGLPLEDAHRILHLERNHLERGIESMEVTVHDFHDWRQMQTSFEGLAGFYTGTANLSGSEGRAERFSGAFISANAFPMLRTRPILGRAFHEGEDLPGAEPVVLLGHDLWQNRYAGEPDVIGRTVRVNGVPHTIIGVMPRGFEFPITHELWLPMKQDPVALDRGDGITLEVFGRLRDGVTVQQARTEFETIAKRLTVEYPETNEGIGSVIKPYTEEYIGEEPARLLFTMLAAVFGVLLIACANVANLLLSRAVVRTKEVAIRSALGATRWQVVRQLLAESLVLSATGALLGLGLAWVGVSLFNAAILDTDPPYWIDIRLDAIALTFVLGVAFVSSLAAGVLPALQASRTDVNEVLKDETRGSSSFRLGKMSKGLVVAEVALACGLLVAAGLTIKSIVKLRTVDFGVATEDVFTARIGLGEAAYPDSTKQVAFFEETVTRLGALPGVRSASLGSNLPVLGSGMSTIAIEGQAYATENDYPRARRAIVAPGYFETFGVALLAGRDFGQQDRAGSPPVAVVNEPFVRRFFPDGEAVGRRFQVDPEEEGSPWVTIVGVVPDLHMGGFDNEDPEGFYVPFAQNPARFMTVAVRTRGDALALTPQVRDEVTRIDPDIPLYWVNSLAGSIREQSWFYRVFGTLFMVFGFTALFLASVGLYGVMAFSVSRRTREVGVRMALGAQARDVVRLILRQGVAQLALGLILGLGLAVLLSRGLEIILFGVESLDPWIFAAVVLALGAVGIAAVLVPARRATTVDPMVALRYE